MVTMDTETIIGYKSGLMTPNERPRPAMMNENSPIWQKQKPDCTEVFKFLPERMKPSVADDDLKKITVAAIISMGTRYLTNICGSTSIPTDTKNTAQKRFFIGVMMRCMTSASMVSASIAPITKAPNAVEKPA